MNSRRAPHAMDACLPIAALASGAEPLPEANRADTHEIEVSRRQLSELAQYLQTSVERERAVIAREIHDDVGGSLTALKMDLAWIGRHSEAPSIQARVAHALETVDLAIEASTRIMHNMRPAILDHGLVAALQWLSTEFEKRHGVTCRFRSSHASMELPTGVPLVAYRFAQESLTNVSKHAEATEVVIELSFAGGALLVELTDNGRGMAPGALDKARSFGIRGLRERASTVGGWVDVNSGATGTSMLLSIPVLRSSDWYEQEFTADDDDVVAAKGSGVPGASKGSA